METTPSAEPGAALHRGQLNHAVRESLRDLSVQMSLLTHRIGGHLDLKGTDLECLDLIDRYGPLSPSTLARRAGLHPATMTGIIDRHHRPARTRRLDRPRARPSSGPVRTANPASTLATA
jgi:MarR family